MPASSLAGHSMLPFFQARRDSVVGLNVVGDRSSELDLVNILWGTSLQGNFLNVHVDSFYSIYKHDLTPRSAASKPRDLDLRDPKELKKIVQYLHDSRDRPLVELEQYDRELLRRCVLIWLRVDLECRTDPDIGEVQDDFWPEDWSLRAALVHLFPRRRTFQTTGDAKFLLVETSFTDEVVGSQSPHPDPSRLKCPTVYSVYPVSHWGKHNTAERLDDWGYFEIEWTNNLLDHLVLEEDESRLDEEKPPKIHLFHHASFLRESKLAPDMFPEGLIEETLDSLALFLRPNEPRITRWFDKENQKLSSDNIWHGPLDKQALRANQCDPRTHAPASPASQRRPRARLGRNLAHYRYWGERLARIDQVFVEMRPSNRRQWWKDTRKRDYTQNVAYSAYTISIVALVLTSVLSLLQIVLK